MDYGAIIPGISILLIYLTCWTIATGYDSLGSDQKVTYFQLSASQQNVGQTVHTIGWARSHDQRRTPLLVHEEYQALLSINISSS